MEASAGVLRRFPSVTGAGARISSHPFHHSCRFSCFSSKSVKLRGMGCGFYDEGYLEYYSSGRGGVIRCGKKKEEKDMTELKKTKKKMKLLKGLSRNLSNLTEMGFGFGSDHRGLVDQVQGKTISEAADLLLGQLQQLKAEEKELKRKRKEEKALMKMKEKEASQAQSSTRNCIMLSSSSSSSESSDDECQNLVDMSSLKIGTLAQTIPEACDRALENATISPGISTIVEPLTLNPEADTSVEISSASSTSTEVSTGRTTSLEVSVPEQKGECCLEPSDCHIGSVGSSVTLGSTSNASIAAATTTTTTAEGTKRIEVCMGGKCKRLGAGALLEEFQRVAGIEAAVSGCKCMGKCKVGPNVRVSGCSSSSISDTFQAGDSVALSAAATTTSSNSLCIGVGLEDVSLIAANLLGRYQVGLANALP